VVIVAVPLLLCAVINPPLLTDKTLVSSDCQFVQVDVTSCVAPLARMPIAVTCTVAPAFVKEERSSGKEKMTTWTVDAARDGVDAAIGDEPHAAVSRLTANRTVRSRFIVVLPCVYFSNPDWLVFPALVYPQTHKAILCRPASSSD
jgi:hypothetical protein